MKYLLSAFTIFILGCILIAVIIGRLTNSIIIWDHVWNVLMWIMIAWVAYFLFRKLFKNI